MVRFLLSAGAEVNDHDLEGQTPLMAAAAFGDVELVTLLIQKGADREAVDLAGRTAWNHAARNGHHDAAKLLEGTSAR